MTFCRSRHSGVYRANFINGNRSVLLIPSMTAGADRHEPNSAAAFHRIGRGGDLDLWTLIVLSIGVITASGPVLTSDGPAHVSMAHFMVHAGDPAWPMLNRLYKINWMPSPNILAHLLMAGLMLLVPPLASEQIIQILCIVSVILAARLVLRRLAPGSGWIALFFFPVAFERMFYMGLYNFCLSVTGCILCIWAFLRLRERRSLANGAVLGALAVVTLASQASGWLEAGLAIGTLTVTEALLQLRAGNPPRSVIRLPAAAAASLAPGAVLFVLFMLLTTGDQHITYGPPPLYRLMAVLRGDAFAPIGRSTAYASLVQGLTLLVLAAAGGIALRLAPAPANASVYRLQFATCLLPLSLLGLALIIPDEAGGGWTHSERAQVFPYVGLAFACALLPIPRAARNAAIAIAAAGDLVMIGMAIWVQLWDVPAATSEFEEANAWIGPHCTVAPVLTQFKLDPANTARLYYQPLFHLASRFELRNDRPVLFSYVARLPIYPVMFRPDADPQRLLYGWQPSQRDTHVYQIDIARFEAASGIPVDFVLLWDFPQPDQPGAWHDIREAVTHAGYRLVHRSSGGRMELYQRTGPGGCAKP